MKKFRCTVCGYVYEGDAAPEKCPLCKAPASKFVEVVEEEGGALTFVDEHVLVAQCFNAVDRKVEYELFHLFLFVLLLCDSMYILEV